MPLIAEHDVTGPRPLSRWTYPLGTLLLGAIALFALYWETAASAVSVWANSDLYGHGFLIVPIAAYLVWRRKDRIADLDVRPSLWGLGLVVATALLWRVGEAMSAQIVQQVALVGMFQAMVVTILGHRVAWALAFPLAYLFLAVPFGEALIGPLQVFTALFVVKALVLSGVPATLDGFLIHIPGGSFHVAEACAGARFLLSAFAIALLAADIFLRSRLRWSLFIALAIIVPIVGNGLRAYGIVMIAYLTDFQVAVGIDHITYGAVFASLVIACLLLIGLALRDRSPAMTLAKSGGQGEPSLKGTSTGGAFVLSLSCVLVLAALPLLMGRLNDSDELQRTKLVPLGVAAPWQSAANKESAWTPSFPGADAELRERFTESDRSVDVYIAYYVYERQGAEVVSAINRLVTNRSLKFQGRGIEPAPIDGTEESWRTSRFTSTTSQRLVWQIYWIDGVFTSNKYFAKLLQAKAGLGFGTQGAAAVLLSTEYNDDPDRARAALRDFLESIEGLGAYLSAVSTPERPSARLMQGGSSEGLGDRS